MASVWVIEQGQYSDYGVTGVFSTQEHAQMIADRINATEEWDKATVAEWPLDPGIEDIREGRQPYMVRMWRDGQVDSVEQENVSRYDIGGRINLFPWEGRLRLCASVWATDVTHAVKIVNEHRTRLIAEGEWK